MKKSLLLIALLSAWNVQAADTQSITADYDRSFGDSEFNELSAGYAIKF
jgi:hypothetical protein